MVMLLHETYLVGTLLKKTSRMVYVMSAFDVF